ncbi:hypothetical protein ACFQRC_07940 [Enterovirga sp. GCM10030262]|uniref:hypothetical protein n=1 Tax=Enterovirga sp. GCM10030262 TaxID=3273391 RepID=UPI0036231E80
MMRTGLPFSLALLLAACGETAAPPADTAEEPAAETAAVAPSAPASAPAANETVAMPPFAEVEGAHPYGPPEPAPIPAAFRGTWAESKALCGDLDHQNRLGISGATVRFPDFIVRTDDVRTLGQREIEIKGVIEGTNRPSDHHFFIDTAGDTLTDGGGGGMVRVRCSG